MIEKNEIGTGSILRYSLSAKYFNKPYKLARKIEKASRKHILFKMFYARRLETLLWVNKDINEMKRSSKSKQRTTLRAMQISEHPSAEILLLRNQVKQLTRTVRQLEKTIERYQNSRLSDLKIIRKTGKDTKEVTDSVKNRLDETLR